MALHADKPSLTGLADLDVRTQATVGFPGARRLGHGSWSLAFTAWGGPWKSVALSIAIVIRLCQGPEMCGCGMHHCHAWCGVVVGCAVGGLQAIGGAGMEEELAPTQGHEEAARHSSRRAVLRLCMASCGLPGMVREG